MSGQEGSGLASRFAELNPFSRSKREDEDDEKGEEVTAASVAGGGHSSRVTGITTSQLRVSHALRSFLVEHSILSKHDAKIHEEDDSAEPTEALQALLSEPHINVPPSVTDRSHPLPEYFISSSHNTYLMAHQLFGTSSAQAYDIALNAGARCVEIDAWDNDEDKDEPKVTHGYTLVSRISFRSVCETMRDFVDKQAIESTQEQGNRAAPILLSLENHCSAQGQLRLVQIMKETWGDRLLSKAVREEGHREQEQDGEDEQVLLEELGAKIVVIVEHHIAGVVENNEDETSSEEEDEESRQAKKAYNEQKKGASAAVIIPELAELGVYAQSVKPSDNSWYEQAVMNQAPHHHLINVSESGLAAHLPAAGPKIALHNAKHLMRVFPMGTRISSNNLRPVPFWGIGAQVCALNWQTFGAGVQLNEALFSGSDGYVLKPAALRAGGSGVLSTGRQKKLRLHVAGATDVPLPAEATADDIKPYLTCVLIHPDDASKPPPKRKTDPYKQHKLGFLHQGQNPSPTHPVWDEVLEWEYEENEMVFLRTMIKSDDSFKANPKLAVSAVRLSYTTPHWKFMRMLDLKGRETTCTLLVKFEIIDV